MDNKDYKNNLISWPLIISITLLILSILYILKYHAFFKIRPAMASTSSSTAFSIKCKSTNTVKAQSKYDIIARLGSDMSTISSIAIVPFDEGKTINLHAVNEGPQEYRGNKYHVTIFEGPLIKHLASCIGRKIDFGNLYVNQVGSSKDNPPLMMGAGNISNIDHFKEVPTNRDAVAHITRGLKSGQGGVTRINYGQGTLNPYRIAVAYPPHQQSEPQSYQYKVNLSSTLE